MLCPQFSWRGDAGKCASPGRGGMAISVSYGLFGRIPENFRGKSASRQGMLSAPSPGLVDWKTCRGPQPAVRGNR